MSVLKTEIIKKNRPFFTLQWHLTAKCEQNCMHCYLKEEFSYKNEIKNELKFKDCILVLNDFIETIKKWNAKATINFTGGDPLLKKEIFKLIRHASNNGLNVGILGNPNLITYDTAVKLRESGLIQYQLSIDGLEKTHDEIRGRVGLFKDTLRAIKILQKVGIITVVMFTLSKINAKDLIKVINLVNKLKVSIFDFARLVPIGSGSQIKAYMLKPNEYRSLLINVLEEYKRLKEMGCYTQFGRKDHLWNLLYLELGLFKKPINENTELIYNGCAVGNNLLTILADGTVYACRRLPIKIGEVPQQKIKEIFIKSPILNKIRDIKKMEKCHKCELLRFCRGCPAVAYGTYKNFYSPDPQCWKL